MIDTLSPAAESSVAATFEPLTLDEAKRQCEVAVNDRQHDVTLGALMVAARETWERDVDRVCCSSTWIERLDAWPDCDFITLGKRPVASVTSVQYVDTAGATQAWSSANYSLDNGRAHPAIVRAYNVSWPSTRSQRNAVIVTYVAGYASAAVVPQAWKQAMLLLVRHWFENRVPVNIGTIVTEIPLAYERLTAHWQRSTYP